MAITRKKVDGGVIALRGFVYQFDRTIQEVINRPNESVEVEHIEDLNGVDWCIQVKNHSSKYKPSTLKKAIKSLWQAHRVNPQLKLRIHCHFADKTPGEFLPLDVENLPPTWLDVLKIDSMAASEKDIAYFLKKLKILFTSNLESQLSDLLKQIRTHFALNSDEDSLCAHAIIRAYMLSVASKRQKSDRIISFSSLKEAYAQHRSMILDNGLTQQMGEEKYIRFISTRLFKKNINLDNTDHAFIIEVQPRESHEKIASLAERISTRYFKIMRTGPKGRPPVLCIKGLPEAEYAKVAAKIYERLYIIISNSPKMPSGHWHLPFVDGHPFYGSNFQLDEINKFAASSRTLLRLIPPHALHENETLRYISEIRAYHFFTDDQEPSQLISNNASRINVKNIDSILRILE